MSGELSQVPPFRNLADVADYFQRHNRELEDRLRRIEAANKSAFVLLSGTNTFTGATYTLDVAGTTLATTNAVLGTLIAVLKRGGKVR